MITCVILKVSVNAGNGPNASLFCAGTLVSDAN